MYKDYQYVIKQLVRDMDIPPNRKNDVSFENICWLKNNLKIANSDHRYYDAAMRVLRILYEYEIEGE